MNVPTVILQKTTITSFLRSLSRFSKCPKTQNLHQIDPTLGYNQPPPHETNPRQDNRHQMFRRLYIARFSNYQSPHKVSQVSAVADAWRL